MTRSLKKKKKNQIITIIKKSFNLKTYNFTIASLYYEWILIYVNLQYLWLDIDINYYVDWRAEWNDTMNNTITIIIGIEI